VNDFCWAISGGIQRGNRIMFPKNLVRKVWHGWRGINVARLQSLPTELNMTKLPTNGWPTQANEEPRHRNVYDYEGEYEFLTAQHWTVPHGIAPDVARPSEKRDGLLLDYVE
jgi:hypothetical protein